MPFQDSCLPEYMPEPGPVSYQIQRNLLRRNKPEYRTQVRRMSRRQAASPSTGGYPDTIEQVASLSPGDRTTQKNLSRWSDDPELQGTGGHVSHGMRRTNSPQLFSALPDTFGGFLSLLQVTTPGTCEEVPLSVRETCGPVNSFRSRHRSFPAGVRLGEQVQLADLRQIRRLLGSKGC